MNKKILSIFALIMAISILGVSCAENPNNPNNNGGGGSTPALSLANAKEVVKAIATLSPANANFDLATASANVSFVSGNDYKVEVTDASSSGDVTTTTLKTALDNKKDAMGTAVTPNITIGSISVAAPSADGKSVVATIPYTTKDGKTGNIKITFKLENNNFTGGAAEDKDQNVTVNKGSQEDPIEVTLSGNTADAAFTVNNETSGATYALVSAVGLAADSGTENISGVDGISTIDNYSINSGSKTITLQKTIVDNLKTALSGSKVGVVKVTISSTADDYKPKDLEVYVKVTGPAAAQKEKITKATLQSEIQKWAEVGAGNDKLVFTGATLGGEGNTIAINAKGNGESGPSVNAIKTAIGTLTEKSLTGIQTIEVANGDFDTPHSDDQNPRTFTITLTAADTHEFNTTDFTTGVSGNKLTITVTVNPKKGNADEAANWVA